MAIFTRKSTLQKAYPRLSLGYVPVNISKISKPVKVDFDGEPRYTVKITFTALYSESELSIDCLCFLSQSSKLTAIFEATHEDFNIDDASEWNLNDLLHQELIVHVEEVESQNGKIYRTITGFLPSDTPDLDLVN